MKDRIRQLMEVRKLTQQNFADILQISPASLSSIFNDRTKPTLNHVEAIHKAFPNISLQWLLYGDGDMYDNHESHDSSAGDPYSTPSASQEPGLLFDDYSSVPTTVPETSRMSVQSSRQPKQPEVQTVKIIDKAPRQISEIRIFYDDQTWETFVPKK